ncbi:hypothetical protein HYPSUDRAFT_41339 [Hypholoma sublateritium FD-334 SS-4]|uniref:Uncharacterized protein n=1 Tax=Hypholoma sublateritium (strain FD-334 SS-4) TaxID=945553 RepID=A0A0D2L5M7_HYPSF|nr:hypothetical protein HYPSUDRAFT_41339 [Hypholoma sublateritium FD-334 SS-4]
MGVEPGNIQLVGDSAGGALIHGVFSHMLHPLAGIPELKLSGPFAGAYFMSTWSKLVNNEENCLYNNDGRGDWLRGKTCGYWGNICMKDIPGHVVPYLEGNSAPDTWFHGVDQCVKRVLFSIGEIEALRDTILEYAECVKKYHPNTTVIVQDLGTHNDPYIDCITGAHDADNLTAMILDWVDEGFTTAEG